MAIEIKRITSANQTLKIVSAQDSAINWEAVEIADAVSEDEKMAAYQADHDISVLKFKEDGDKPTIFVFKHPARQDIATEMRALYSKIYNPVNKKLDVELFSEVFNGAFIGTEEGFEGALTAVPRDKNRKISADFLQALEDAGVYDEIALAFVNVANSKRKKDPDSAKK